MNGRSVLYVPGVAEQKRHFLQSMHANEMTGMVLDIADEDSNTSIDRQLIAAVGFQTAWPASISTSFPTNWSACAPG